LDSNIASKVLNKQNPSEKTERESGFRLHLGAAMKRRGSHQANDGRAIGVSNESTLSHPNLDSLHGIRINLRDHKRDILIHTKRRAIINHDGPSVHSNGTKLFTNGASGAEKGDIDAFKAFGGELFDCVVVALECEVSSGGAFGSEHLDGAEREFTVGEDGKKLLAHGACDTHHGHGRRIFLERHADCGGSDGLQFGLRESEIGEKWVVVCESGHFGREIVKV
jgi:hypothetical protein